MAKSILKSIIFVSLVFCLVAALASWLRPVRYTQAFYDQEENTVDVLLLGSSHTHCNINPNILWDESGLAAHGFTSPAQPLSATYYYMQEALKSQTPQLIVLDVLSAYLIENEDGYLDADSPNLKMAANGLKFSPTKLEMVESNVRQGEDKSQFILDLALYHNRWRILSKDWDDNEFRYKGFMLKLGTTDKITPIDAPENLLEYPKTTKTADLLPRNLDYLNRIIALAKEKDIDLLLIKTPNPSTLKNVDEQAIYNNVHLIAEEAGVPFVDFNRDFEKIGLDFSTDFLDEGHLNIYGAEKFSRYFASYLDDRYHLPDHRSDSSYQQWDAQVDQYLQFQNLLALKHIKDVSTYGAKLEEIDQYLIASSARNQFKIPQNYDLGLLKPLGVVTGVGSDAYYSYFSVYNKTGLSAALHDFHTENSSKESIVEYKNLRESIPVILDIQSNHFEENSRASIKINGNEASINRTGLNFVVYDPVNEMVVDSFNISPAFDAPYIITR